MNTTHPIEIRINAKVPQPILDALSHQRGRYTNFEHLFHCIHVDIDHWMGVAGDGDNGSYEYFVMKKGQFTCSNEGWGCVEHALLKVLTQEVAA